MSQIFTELEWKDICSRRLVAKGSLTPGIAAICARELLAELGVESCPLEAAEMEINHSNGDVL